MEQLHKGYRKAFILISDRDRFVAELELNGYTYRLWEQEGPIHQYGCTITGCMFPKDKFPFNKKKLKEIMDAHGDLNKDLAVYLGMSVPNFSTIWNGRQQFNVKHIRLIALRYALDPQQVWDIFLFPECFVSDINV